MIGRRLLLATLLNIWAYFAAFGALRFVLRAIGVLSVLGLLACDWCEEPHQITCWWVFERNEACCIWSDDLVTCGDANRREAMCFDAIE